MRLSSSVASGLSIVSKTKNLLPKNRPQDPMQTKDLLFELSGNLETYNMHPGLHKQLVEHKYLKSLYVFDTFDKVVDLIYAKVTYVEPWASRGDSKPSSAWIYLYKLFTLQLSEEQVSILLDHGDSPYLRAMGALYVRYGADPSQLWRWLGEYADDLEFFAPSTDPRATVTFGAYCVRLLTDQSYYGTTFPALGVAVQRQIKVRLVLHEEAVQRARRNSRCLGTRLLEVGATVRAVFDDWESEPRWYEARIEAVVPPYEGAPEGTWPRFDVAFSSLGCRARVRRNLKFWRSCGEHNSVGGRMNLERSTLHLFRDCLRLVRYIGGDSAKGRALRRLVVDEFKKCVPLHGCADDESQAGPNRRHANETDEAVIAAR